MTRLRPSRWSTPTNRELPAHAVGPGRILLGGYVLFVVAAGGRSTAELAEQVTLSRGLSALAAGLYLAGSVLISRVERGRARRATATCAALELSGVVVVGALTAAGALDPDTVWGHFGAGYLFVPLLLPLAVLAWLASKRRDPVDDHAVRRSADGGTARSDTRDRHGSEVG